VRISHAAFALANPISGDFIRMTNRDWQFSTDEVRRTLGLTTLLIVNDFTALAMALPGFKPDELLQIGGGKPQPHAVAGVLGPGTGLGVSGVIPTVDGFVTLGSEGGHVNFAPADEREFAILQYAWREWQHVSNERLISGPGMEIIYRALAQRNGVRRRRATPPTSSTPRSNRTTRCAWKCWNASPACWAARPPTWPSRWAPSAASSSAAASCRAWRSGSPRRRSARASKPRAASRTTWRRSRPTSS
jgi:glucokinase